MNDLKFSIIVPVFNRPQETVELLESLSQQQYQNFEVIVVEDGSTEKSESLVKGFTSKINVEYFYKPNTGPGDSRNFGSARASGDYLVFFDSDCVIPSDYLFTVNQHLTNHPLVAYGGPDKAHADFSTLQTAINYSMTSFLTTGGIRGHAKDSDSFQPRSFNMGIQRQAFEQVGGFSNIHPGEDPDLAIRLRKLGLRTGLIPEAWVFHKRRTNLGSFAKQVYKFGIARSILMKWHTQGKSWMFFAPSIALICLVFMVIFGIFVPFFWWILPLIWLVIFVDALFCTRNLAASTVAIVTTMVQILGYGWGFLKGYWLLHIEDRNEREIFRSLFYH